MKEATINTNDLRKEVENEENLELLYALKAWQKLSNEKKIEEDLSFDSFYNRKIELTKLSSILNKLSKHFKVFEPKRVRLTSLKEDELIKLLGLVKTIEKLPSVNDIFYLDRGKRVAFSVSNQIAQLGINLLNNDSKELYVPFTDGFAYSNYTDKKIYADNYMPMATIHAELINILENKDITFKEVNALEDPSFININAPHLLKEFDSVLSFPPFGLKGKIDISSDKFNRFHFQKGSVLDVAHFEHILSQTKNKAVVLMPVGFTYRSGSDEEFRQFLIGKNLLEAVIQLPPNLHSATSIETTFFVINKQKEDDKVHFINLKDESFITRDGRKLVFKSLEDILDIYKNKKEIDSIASIVSNDDIANNNYSLAIDRYVISKEAKELQKTLEQFELVELEEIADIKRSQLFKDEREGLEIFELSPSDFSKAGFTLECGKTKQIGSQERRLATYKLEPYDVLLSTKGTIGKVAIIGEVNKPMMASQAIQVIRAQGKDKKEKAIALYMFFKSDLGQTILSSLVAGVAMPQISTAEIKKLQIPLFTKDNEKQTVLNFNNEVEMYNKINYIEENIQQLHNNFLGEK